MSLIPMMESMKGLVEGKVGNKAKEEAEKNVADPRYSGLSKGQQNDINNTAAAKVAEHETFIMEVMYPPVYESMLQLLTAVLTPIAAAVGIPGFVVKHTIAKMAVNGFIGPEPGGGGNVLTFSGAADVINSAVAQNPDDPEAFNDMASDSNLQASAPKPKRG